MGQGTGGKRQGAGGKGQGARGRGGHTRRGGKSRVTEILNWVWKHKPIFTELRLKQEDHKFKPSGS